MSIVEFLNARIAEDEAAAMAASAPGAGYEPQPIPGTVLLARNVAARTLAECKAKRAIIAAGIWTYYNRDEVYMGCEAAFNGGRDSTECTTYDLAIRALASVYADHPDHDPAWA